MTQEHPLFPGAGTEPAARRRRTREEILAKLASLRALYASGSLGGQSMPEDANPGLPKDSAMNYHYFTLGMVLNYQRDSYALWRAARSTYEDEATRFVFSPSEVSTRPDADTRVALLRHRLALQPQRHVANWITVCHSITRLFAGDIRALFANCASDVPTILVYLQVEHKRDFPYLGGEKICHYWLSVMERYTSVTLKNREAISVAPDTHVIQASVRLGVVDPGAHPSSIQEAVRDGWNAALEGSGIAPIDVHSPLWLWSRAGFPTLPV